jgi:membrane protease YdiL (CAAX protease family)
VTLDPAAQPYHRLYRTLAGYRWWRPLLALLLAGIYYIGFSIVVAIPVFILVFATGQVSLDDPAQAQQDIQDLAMIDAASPVSLLLALGSLAVLLPAVQLALLSAGLRPTGVRHSVAFRLRWRWLWLSSVPALVMVVAGIGIPMLIGALTGDPIGEFTTDPALFALCLAIILVLTPFQAAAEEYVFRGFLTQIVGSWIRFAPVALLVPTALFAAGHLYDVPGLVSVAIFGFGAAIVVWRTGGLEAGITYHTLNNIGAFVLLASGVYGTTVNEPETASDAVGAVLVIGSTLAGTGLWVLWVLWLARRKGITRLGGRVDVPAAPADA